MKKEEEIKKEIQELVDKGYQEFHSNLCPGTENILGVRVPVLRDYAKRLLKEEGNGVLTQIGNTYYEEIMLQGMVLGLAKWGLEERLTYLKEFIPKIDNWAVCDITCAGLKFTNTYKKEVWEFLKPYFTSSKEFEVRFGVVMLLDFYLTPEYIEEVLKRIDGIDQHDYYVQMAIAWLLSVAYIKFPEITMAYLQNNKLDDFTYNKGLQKIVESYRVSKEAKEVIKSMKRK